MVTTTEILPCPALKPFIRCYTLREFDTLGHDFLKPLPANHEFTLAFTLRGTLYTYKTSYQNLRPESKQHIIGLQTSSKGVVIFNGDIRLFTIQFKPNGFYRLFGIPSQLITDQIYETSEVIASGTQSYKQQLDEAINLLEMKRISDKFLLLHLSKSKVLNPYYSITSASSLVFENHGNVNIKSLAYYANMSLKCFELKFTEQVGIPPKLFARIIRFNHALLMKIQNEAASWTDISHKSGYYDQMHFIKEFKEFAGDSPGNFYKNTPLPSEAYKHQ